MPVITELAAALRGTARATAAGSPAGAVHHSLGGGLGGLALFFAYLHLALPGRGHDLTTSRILDLAIERSNAYDSLPSLYGGFAGVAWVIEHLQGWLLDPDGEDPGAAIADGIHDLLGGRPWRREWDLMGGLVGLGVWAGERAPRPGGRESMALVVERLAELAERRPEGITWRPLATAAPSAAATVDGSQGAEESTVYNLGLAHGVPGVIGFLAEACAAGVASDLAYPLLEGAVDWLLDQRLPPGSPARFPPARGPGVEPAPSRTAWCYGDLGIAAALLAAARHVQREDWEAEARELARGVARRPPESSQVVDAGLCHGAAGISHLFNRLFHATGDPLLGDAAIAWLRRALEMRRPGSGLAGFQAWLEDESGALAWQPIAGLLYGAAGIGLAFLAAAAPIEPAWDRVMLVSIPARPGQAPAPPAIPG